MRKSARTLSSFFSNKGNRTLTFFCSLFAACACTFPFADSYWAARAERLDASSKAQDLQDLKDRVVLLTEKRTETSETVAQLRELVVEEEDIEAFRNEIVEIVRTADCRLRNISLAERYERPWKEDDNVLSDGNDLDPDDLDAVTGYSLQTQKLALNVSGKFENIQKVIKAIQAIDKFLYTVKLDIESDSNQEIALQWELAIVGLVYTPPEIFDDEDW